MREGYHVVPVGNWDSAATSGAKVADIALCRACPAPRNLRTLTTVECGDGARCATCGRTDLPVTRYSGYWQAD